MSKKVETITIQELEKQIQEASKDDNLPAWTSLLFSMILILIKQLVSERDELRRKLYGKPKSERQKTTKPKSTSRKARNPNRITLDKTDLEENQNLSSSQSMSKMR